MKKLHALVVPVLVAGALAGAGCKEKDVLTLRLTSTHINLLYYSRGRVLFTPTGDTEFKQTGGGSWANGNVVYSVENGNFQIVMDGVWMQNEVIKNREGDFPGAYVIEIPLKNIEDSGTFTVLAEYSYYDPADDTERIIARDERDLVLPFEGGSYGSDVFGMILQCTDYRGEACSTTGPDPDRVEVPDVPDIPDIPDIPDTATDTDIPDTATDTSVPDTSADTSAEPDTTDDTPAETGDPSGDAVTETPVDAGGEDSSG